jgi:hypothetical protein
MTIKEFLSILDTECVDSICIVKGNEILWSDTDFTTVPTEFLNQEIKLVTPQYNTDYDEDFDGEMYPIGSSQDVIIEIN